jgi:hypothetical protein
MAVVEAMTPTPPADARCEACECADENHGCAIEDHDCCAPGAGKCVEKVTFMVPRNHAEELHALLAQLTMEAEEWHTCFNTEKALCRTSDENAGSTPSQPASKRADTLGPCEFPRCSDPKNERPYAVVHCAHKGERLLWCQMRVYPTPEHHLLIRSLDTSADNPPTETRCFKCGGTVEEAERWPVCSCDEKDEATCQVHGNPDGYSDRAPKES